MGKALDKHLPMSARSPSFGGTAYWVRGPERLDSARLAQEALKKGIFIEPMRITFAAKHQPRHFFRLAFSSIAEDKIEPGIKLLSETIRTIT
jgi:GntR family transcriptional regulator/MocR family aminotransferase